MNDLPDLYRRPCACPHRYPLCACPEALTGEPLAARSRWLSLRAGWPSPAIAAAEADWVLARYLRPPAPKPTPDPRLALVAACPHRGNVLPHTQQPEGCGCGELSECRAGRGRAGRPGAVTLAECLACVVTALP